MKTIPATEFDATMLSHQKSLGAKTVVLGPGIYETKGSAAWYLPPDVSLVGAGIDKTIIRRVDPKARFVVNGWVAGGLNARRVSDLTLDCNASLRGPEAPCGLGAHQWKDATIERVKVIGLGSFDAASESFGIVLSQCQHSSIRYCVVDRVAGGYVSAFCVSGDTVVIQCCTANFTWQKGWDPRRQAFCLAGDSTSITISDNRTDGALNGVFCDTGKRVDRLAISGNIGNLRSWGSRPTTEIHLTGEVAYTNVRIYSNRWKTK